MSECTTWHGSTDQFSWSQGLPQMSDVRHQTFHSCLSHSRVWREHQGKKRLKSQVEASAVDQNRMLVATPGACQRSSNPR